MGRLESDIDEQKETANALRQFAAELSEADRRKNEFLAMLAHELRNPLAPIRNAAKSCTAPDADPDQTSAATAVMRRQVGQMVRLIDDLLDVSRISRGDIELRRTGRLDLAGRPYARSGRPRWPQAASISRPRFPRSPIYINADPARVSQIIGNLLNNASNSLTPAATCALN